MPYQEFQENWRIFSELIDKIPNTQNEQINNLLKQYIEQNLIILNDVFSTSIENLKRLQNAKTANDIICTQAKFTNEISKKLTLSTQRFLNASLGHIADYNEWLKAHCDLATD
jgi:methionine synthase I (cobalamin-dependent)